MHEMLTVVTDVGGVCLSVSLSVTRLKTAAARAVCRVRGVIRCSLCQMPLDQDTVHFCYSNFDSDDYSSADHIQRIAGRLRRPMYPSVC